MKPKVRKTSIDCYYGNIKNKSENKQFRLIIDCLLEKGSATRGEIAHHLKMEKSTVAARVNAMLKYGILQEVGKRKDKKAALIIMLLLSIKMGKEDYFNEY